MLIDERDKRFDVTQTLDDPERSHIHRLQNVFSGLPVEITC